MTTQTETKPRRFNIGRMDFGNQKPKVIRVRSGDAEWVLGDGVESHDPMDRVGGPYRIHDFCTECNYGERFFLACLGGSYFPPMILVMADTWADAYENLIDWLAEGHWGHVVTDEKELKEMEENPDGICGISFSSNGVPVYDEEITMNEVQLVSLEF